jgi:hypothetical protein
MHKDALDHAVSSVVRSCGAVVLGLLSVGVCGCGMLPIPIPHVKTLPRPPLQKLLIRDAVNNVPITNAAVSFEMWRHNEWMRPRAYWEFWDERNLAVMALEAKGGRQDLTIRKAKNMGGGLYFLEAERRRGNTIFFFPFPTVMGWKLYQTYDGSVFVKAEGYAPMRLYNDLGLTRGPSPPFLSELPPVDLVVVKDDKVEVFMIQNTEVGSTPSQSRPSP